MVPAILQACSTVALPGDDGRDDGWVNAVPLTRFFDEGPVNAYGFQVHLGKHFRSVDPYTKRKETFLYCRRGPGQSTNSASAPEHPHSSAQPF